MSLGRASGQKKEKTRYAKYPCNRGDFVKANIGIRKPKPREINLFQRKKRKQISYLVLLILSLKSHY